MGSHPVNLAIRFILEICALFIMGVWGWRHSADWFHILSFGIPVLTAIAWATFAVPDDPSRSGSAPIPTPGIIRLLLELLVFIMAIWMLHDMDYESLWWIMAGAVVLHYVVSYDRIKWLIKQ